MALNKQLSEFAINYIKETGRFVRLPFLCKPMISCVLLLF